MGNKVRLDILLVEKGLAKSRTHAQSLIMAGKVMDKNGHLLQKAGLNISLEEEITVKQDCPWVSRAGLKLEKALDHFKINVENTTCIDVGASTGGFTDVLLHNGASKVYAVDVGYGQLDNKIRVDERVIVLDKTNARTLNPDIIQDLANVIVCDASFISLKKVLPAAMQLTQDNTNLVALIKPQFEAGKDKIGKRGIIKDTNIHQEICNDIKAWFNAQDKWQVKGLIESPITGAKGNKEFLIYVVKS